MSWIWHKTASDEEALGLASVKYTFFTITPQSILTGSGSNYKGPIYWSPRSFKITNIRWENLKPNDCANKYYG